MEKDHIYPYRVNSGAEGRQVHSKSLVCSLSKITTYALKTFSCIEVRNSSLIFLSNKRKHC